MIKEKRITKEQKAQIKSLTWKYFIGQNFQEIFLFLIIGLAIVYFPYSLGYYIGNNLSSLCNLDWISKVVVECSPLFLWVEGLIYILGVIVIFTFVFLLCCWINYNWKKARRKAMEVVNG